jgi:hypothetical protein
VIERCLNHTEQTKVKRIYQRAQYEAPMREAWQRLGDRLALLADKPGNVVTLTRAAYLFLATPSPRLIPEGEHRDTLTRRRWLVFLGRGREWVW